MEKQSPSAIVSGDEGTEVMPQLQEPEGVHGGWNVTTRLFKSLYTEAWKLHKQASMLRKSYLEACCYDMTHQHGDE